LARLSRRSRRAGALPAPLGGTSPDGTYVLTKNEGLSTGERQRAVHSSQTLEIAGADDIALVSDDLPAG
jgi:hypothetical protein